MNLPHHLAIIMDGNGRWAKEQGLPRLYGHQKGADVVRNIVTHSRKIGIKALTLYAFSKENWQRPQNEVDGLMSLLVEFMVSERQLLLDHQVHFHPIGALEMLPDFVRDPLFKLQEETEENAQMVLNVALSYSGKEEIIQAVQRLIASGDHSDVTAEKLDSYLYTHQYGGDVDLLIRTGNDQRISNFLLWQIAYGELHFEPSYWPDFSPKRLDEILKGFTLRERRFGKTSEQLTNQKN